MLGFSELPPAMRRNLTLETAYAASAGVVSSLALLAQVVVVGSLGGGAAEVTLITAAQPASNVLQPLWAEAARRYRLQSLALVSGVLRCLPFLFIGWITDPWLFTAMNVLFYFFAGPLTLAVPSLYRYNYAETHRGRVIGFLRMFQQGLAMPIMLGAALLLDSEKSLYQVIYPLGGTLGLFGLLFYAGLRIPNDDPDERRRLSERPTFQNLRTVLRTDARFRLFQATIFLTGAGFLMSRSIWLFLLRDQFELSQFEMTLLVQFLPVLLGAVLSPVWGAIIDRTSVVAGRIGFAWLGIFAYAALFTSFWAHSLVLNYVGAILRGIVLPGAEVATTAGNLYFSVKRERAALYESISSVFQGARGLFMPLLGWFLFLQIGVYLFLVPTVLNLWSLRVALKLWRIDRAESPKEAFARRVEGMEDLTEMG